MNITLTNACKALMFNWMSPKHNSGAGVEEILRTLVSQKPQFGTTALHDLPVFPVFPVDSPPKRLS